MPSFWDSSLIQSATLWSCVYRSLSHLSRDHEAYPHCSTDTDTELKLHWVHAPLSLATHSQSFPRLLSMQTCELAPTLPWK